MYYDAARQALDRLYRALDDVPGIDDQYYRPLGYTVYRTYYSPETDILWDKLIADLELMMKESIEETFGFEDEGIITNGEVEATRKLKCLVHLDALSDPVLLDGCDDEQLRQIFLDTKKNDPIHGVPGRHRVFLVVDSTVFEKLDCEMPWIRAVEIDYEAERYEDWRNPRFANQPQRYWGWMKLSLESLFEL
ncbi:hypothetical protein VHEMI06762 [[Torrubiella] hemipterigena]|uniref:Uncharacterized protein n=1 Tax=[Torrubiella] hemipterigena TaxID=1531966 RepID=A0A0A1TK73_9HYPO|nr:hypothetical protein VHEMI06762 [[Torrubiella] hemipterigena]